MKTHFLKCIYCNNRPPLHEKCINGKKSKKTNQTIICGCGC